jgi:hypothetical protein
MRVRNCNRFPGAGREEESKKKVKEAFHKERLL